MQWLVTECALVSSYVLRDVRPKLQRRTAFPRARARSSWQSLRLRRHQSPLGMLSDGSTAVTGALALSYRSVHCCRQRDARPCSGGAISDLYFTSTTSSDRWQLLETSLITAQVTIQSSFLLIGNLKHTVEMPKGNSHICAYFILAHLSDGFVLWMCNWTCILCT